MSDFQRAYYRAFVVALVICFSPFKGLAYVAPLLVTALLLKAGLVQRTRVVVAAFLVVALAVVYMLATDEFLIDTYLLAIVTHSSFLPFLLIDARLIASRELVRRIAIAASWALLIEGSYGTIQAIYGFTQTGSFGGANGDYVEGTIHPSLSAELAFGNPMFATNMVFLLLACLAHPALVRTRWPFLAAGTLALVLASVVHVLIFAMVATILALVLVYSRRALGRQRHSAARPLLVGVLAIGTLSYVALGESVSHVARYGETAFDMEALAVPRTIMLYRVFAELPDEAPLQPLLGLGPGQFSSRASLIASGMYLGGPDTPRAVPLIEPQSTRLAADYCIDLYVMFLEQEADIGSTQQPFFSLLTVYTELGVVGVAIVIVGLFRVLSRVRRRAAAAPEHRPTLVLVGAGVLFLVLLGLQQTYWEVPQAILVGVLVLTALYASTMSPHLEASSEEASAQQPLERRR